MTQRSVNRWRRDFLHRALQGAGLIVLAGCDKLYETETFQAILNTAEGANRRIQRLLTPKNKLAQEFGEKDISPCSGPTAIPRRIRRSIWPMPPINGAPGVWRSTACWRSRVRFHWPN